MIPWNVDERQSFRPKATNNEIITVHVDTPAKGNPIPVTFFLSLEAEVAASANPSFMI